MYHLQWFIHKLFITLLLFSTKMHFLYQAHIVKQHEPKTSEKSLYQENYTHYTDLHAKARHSLVYIKIKGWRGICLIFNKLMMPTAAVL